MRSIWIRTISLAGASIAGLFTLALSIGWDSQDMGWPLMGIIAVLSIQHAVATIRFWEREEAAGRPVSYDSRLPRLRLKR